VTGPAADVVLPTRRLAPEMVRILRSLKPGDRIRITTTIRVGARRWSSRIEGSFRGVAYLDTGVTTERVREDDLVVPILRFTKPNGELASVTIDENVVVEML
jgi:hypothetical protein